ncbi:hypothetical protein PILCRDRAFT_822647 [Piloderma croceum F 1598]|uniref:Dienelactone hydrolase domain-containing protein n=1 Tax=Piloderma croceum (strain F 1598) TaxID=765440 RepID=A0A0C3B1R4_PILCF|nr:hypothetical protein PILCRDRAFT_822647 [Piloderma croceum F 1598]
MLVEFAKILKEEKQLTEIGVIEGSICYPYTVSPLNEPHHSTEDITFTESVKTMVKDILANKPDLPSELKTYNDTTHGFAARPNMGIPEVKDAFQGPFDQTVDWFKLHLINV